MSAKQFGLTVLNKIITSLSIVGEETLAFTFTDGSSLNLRDNGQLCCEHRFIRTDDNLADCIGAILLGIEVRDAPTEWTDDERGHESKAHEVQFLTIITNNGTFTVSNHNIHNGYYGGFSIIEGVSSKVCHDHSHRPADC